ncbi:ornithine decarboxylase-like [Pistacia vera]|uniref:ornithine decarboxylase-like n=1 Tax=Pistacia vera TaxID=55513 RepID=UPI0012633BE4|nr:ornithine decarboxylase-like [Pistacia vera]
MGSFPTITIQTILGAPGVKDNNLKVLTKTKNGGLTECMKSIIYKEDVKEAFYLLDLDVVMSLYDKWTANLPMIQPFYAIKSNPEKSLIGTLNVLGANFDCASKAEIETVLSLGVSPDRIIFANTCKLESHIKFAASVGVNLTTFDSIGELNKIHKWHPKCDLIIRIKAPDDSKSRRPLGSKFGALPTEVSPMLQAAKSLHLNVIGVSFHVGSATNDGDAFIKAISASKTVFDTAAQLGMPKMRVLDIGGGFLANSLFEDVATAVKTGLEAHFPNEPGLNIISEPGRFFAETTVTLAANIIGKRTRGEVREYWINDGTYGTFHCVIRDALNEPLVCKPLSCKGLKTYSSNLFGPTCDSQDVVLREYQLPELEVNDWLVFPNMGAYTYAFGSSFNGFKTSDNLFYLVTSS